MPLIACIDDSLSDENDSVHALPNLQQYNKSKYRTSLSTTANERLYQLQSSTVHGSSIDSSTAGTYSDTNIKHNRNGSSIDLTKIAEFDDYLQVSDTTSAPQFNHTRHTSLINERLNRISVGISRSNQSATPAYITQNNVSIDINENINRQNAFHHRTSSSHHRKVNSVTYNADNATTENENKSIVHNVNTFHSLQLITDNTAEEYADTPSPVASPSNHVDTDLTIRLQRSYTRMAKLKLRKPVAHNAHIHNNSLDSMNDYAQSPSNINRTTPLSPMSTAARISKVQQHSISISSTYSDTSTSNNKINDTYQLTAIQSDGTAPVDTSPATTVQLRQQRIDEMRRKVNALSDNKATHPRSKSNTRLGRIERLKEMKQHINMTANSFAKQLNV